MNLSDFELSVQSKSYYELYNLHSSLKEQLIKNNTKSSDREKIREKIEYVKYHLSFMKMLSENGIGDEFLSASIDDFKDGGSISNGILMFPLLRNKEIKERKESIKFKIYDFLEKIVNNSKSNLDRGIGLILTGPVGIGKTHLASAILKKYITDNPNIRDCSGFRARTCGFVTIFDLIALGSSRSFGSDKTFEDVRSKDILIIDEMCAEGSAYDSSDLVINRVIRHRYNSRKMTIITSNASINKFYEMYGERGCSILLGKNYYHLVLNGEDRRFEDGI